MNITSEDSRTKFKVGDIVKPNQHPYISDKLYMITGYTVGFEDQNPLYCAVSIADNNRLTLFNMVTMEMCYTKVA